MRTRLDMLQGISLGSQPGACGFANATKERLGSGLMLGVRLLERRVAERANIMIIGEVNYECTRLLANTWIGETKRPATSGRGSAQARPAPLGQCTLRQGLTRAPRVAAHSAKCTRGPKRGSATKTRSSRPRQTWLCSQHWASVRRLMQRVRGMATRLGHDSELPRGELFVMHQARTIRNELAVEPSNESLLLLVDIQTREHEARQTANGRKGTWILGAEGTARAARGGRPLLRRMASGRGGGRILGRACLKDQRRRQKTSEEREGPRTNQSQAQAANEEERTRGWWLTQLKVQKLEVTA